MKSNRIQLSNVYNSRENATLEIADRFIRDRFTEMIENLDVEMVWNYGEEITNSFSILVTDTQHEEYGGRKTLAVFPLNELLDEYTKITADAIRVDDANTETLVRYLQDFGQYCIKTAERLEKIRNRAKEKERRDDANWTKLNSLIDEEFPELSFKTITQRRDEAQDILLEKYPELKAVE